jgi:hypothetical protein
MINLDHVHKFYTIAPVCKHALRVFHAIEWLILLAHAQTNFPPVVAAENIEIKALLLILSSNYYV